MTNQVIKILDRYANKKNTKLNIAGLSFKDDSTLVLFKNKGHKTWRLDLTKDLNLNKKNWCRIYSI